RFIVAFDPEGEYRTEAQRETHHATWVGRIIANLPVEYRTLVVKQQVSRLIQIETWGTEPFEFAHFTNREIAAGINRLLRKRRKDGPRVDVARVAAIRTSSVPNLDKLLRRWRLS